MNVRFSQFALLVFFTMVSSQIGWASKCEMEVNQWSHYLVKERIWKTRSVTDFVTKLKMQGFDARRQNTGSYMHCLTQRGVVYRVKFSQLVKEFQCYSKTIICTTEVELSNDGKTILEDNGTFECSFLEHGSEKDPYACDRL